MGPEYREKADVQRPEMTADEKKAQRTAKAAEKKARAEAAAQKKKDAVKTTPKPPKKSEDIQDSPQAVDENKESVVVTHPSAKDSPSKSLSFAETSMQKESALPPSMNRKAEKSMLKSASSDCHGEKTVKFDMSPDSARTASLENLQNYGLVNHVISISDVHPAFLTLAMRCEKGLVFEIDELCIEFLNAFEEYFEEWATHRAKEETHAGDVGPDLSAAIRPQIAHLTENGKWALPAALGNIVRQLKREILHMGKDEKTAAESLSHWIENCRKVSFELAYRGIADHLAQKLTSSHRKIVTFSWYPAVEAVLLHCKDSGISCCVVDAELNGHGQKLAKTLSSKGIVTQYTDLFGLSAAVPQSSMILFGCSAVLSNGNVVSSKGSLAVALMAKAFNIPVLVLAQSFKFVDKVQSVGRVALLRRESDEIIPSDLVTALITDIRILPPTSAPAVLKIKALDME